MEESAAGRDDEVRVSMVRHLLEVGLQSLHHLIGRMWGRPIRYESVHHKCALAGTGDAAQKNETTGIRHIGGQSAGFEFARGW